MRLFACRLPDNAGHAAASATARRLLERAVDTAWGVPLPEIAVTPDGKPYFPAAQAMHFSISHTKTHALVGVSEHDIGVDIETDRPVSERLHKRLFSENMRRTFTFFEGWCARESVFKLTGQGGLMSMELAFSDGEIATPFEGVRCRIYHCVPGCTAAVACVRGDFPQGIEFIDL